MKEYVVEIYEYNELLEQRLNARTALSVHSHILHRISDDE